MSTEGALVESFQLLDVGVTAAFNDVRARQQAATQEVQRATADLNVASINAASSVLAAQQEAALIVSQATVSAQQLQLTTDATGASLNARYTAEAVSYKNLQLTLNLTTPELLALIWLDAQAEAYSSSGVTPTVRLPASLEAEFA